MRATSVLGTFRTCALSDLLRRECRMFSAALYARVLFYSCILHTRPRVQRIRHSLLPRLREDDDRQSSGKSCRENADVYLLFDMKRSSHHVIASQRVGAKRRPMTGSAKQSIYQPAR